MQKEVRMGAADGVSLCSPGLSTIRETGVGSCGSRSCRGFRPWLVGGLLDALGFYPLRGCLLSLDLASLEGQFKLGVLDCPVLSGLQSFLSK